MAQELWADVKGYEGIYQISSLGRIKSLSRIDKRGHKRTERIMKSTLNGRGYRYVVFQDGKTKVVHRLVAEAFVDNPQGKPYVNHLNGIKTDNRADNLEWVTHEENIQHAWDSGLVKARSGEESPNAALTNQQAEEIRILYKYGKYTHAELAELFGVSDDVIQRITSNKSYKNSGGTEYAAL